MPAKAEVEACKREMIHNEWPQFQGNITLTPLATGKLTLD